MATNLDPKIEDLLSRSLICLENGDDADEHHELIQELRDVVRAAGGFDPHAWDRAEVHVYTRPETRFEPYALRHAVIKAMEQCDPSRDHASFDYTRHGQPTDDPSKVDIVVQVIPAD